MPNPITKSILQVTVALVALKAGWAFWSLPSDEVTWFHKPLIGICGDEGCFRSYTVVIGNTGSNPQEEIHFSLPTALLEKKIAPVSVKFFGARKAPFEIEESDDTAILRLEPLAAGKQVEITVLTKFANPSEILSWDEIPHEVSNYRGSLREGVPEQVRFSRFLYRFLTIF